MKKSTRIVAIAVLAALCAWGVFFGLCKVPWQRTDLQIGTPMTVEFWVWERPKDVPGKIVHTFDSVGMRKQVRDVVISFLIVCGLTMVLLRWKPPTKGRCPKCDYDLRGDLSCGCLECGWRRESAA